VQRRADANATHKQKKEALNALTPSQVNAMSKEQQEERSQFLKSRNHFNARSPARSVINTSSTAYFVGCSAYCS
jgi:hypothetical protein